jgi:hypothetical protein
LWVNEPTESPAGVTATDTNTPITVTSFAIRQASGIGTLTIDDLIVAATYSAAYDNFFAGQPVLLIQKSGNNVNLYWQAAATGYVLETTTKLGTGSWQPVNVTPIVENNMWKVTLPIEQTNTFFRLRK